MDNEGSASIYDVPNGTKGIVVATGDVRVCGTFEGMILSGGTVEFLPNASVKGNSVLVAELFQKDADLGAGAKFIKYFNGAKKTLCIDHHISNNNFADENIVVPTASSASEVMFSLFDEDKIDYDVACCLYLGIVHDSGVFKYSSTSENTMNIAGKLMSKGIDFQTIIDEGFYSKSYRQNQILGRALLESILFMDGRCIVATISKKMMDFYEIGREDEKKKKHKNRGKRKRCKPNRQDGTQVDGL